MQRQAPLRLNAALTEPVFVQEALKIGKKLGRMNEADTASLHGISSKLAQSVTTLHREWARDYPEGEGIPAGLAYTGDAYGGLKASEWDDILWQRAQEHLRIGSGVYGIVRPLDRILPYRCEMALKWPVGSASGPAAFWKPKVTRFLAQELSGAPLVDLSSGEYGAVLDEQVFRGSVLRCDFRELKNGKAVFVGVFGKRARGSMAKHLLEQAHRPLNEAVDSFQTDGYVLNSELSTPTLRVFTR